MHRALTQYGIVLLALCLCMATYWQGLSGDFVLDDYPHIVTNTAIHIDNLNWVTLKDAATSSQAGPLGRPIAMLSFAINYSLTGLDPFFFKLVNLIIHMLTGLLIFLLCRIWLPRFSLAPNVCNIAASLVASMWVIHPIQLTSVLYVVQRMNSLSILFCVLALLCYSKFRQTQIELGLSRPIWIVATGIAGILGLLSKENAGLLLLYIALVEWFIFRGKAISRPIFVSILGLCIAPYLLAALYILLAPDHLLSAYATRDYGIGERLLSEARVMWLYLYKIVLPFPDLFAIFDDDFIVSRGWLTPASSLFSVVGLAGLAGFALWCKDRAVSFGIFLFLGGHLMESTVYPLEPLFDHRNYLPLLGILIATICPLASIQPRRWQAICFLGIVICTLVTGFRAIVWSNREVHLLYEVEHHPHSARAHYELGRYYGSLLRLKPDSTELFQKTEYHYTQAAQVNNKTVMGILALMNLYAGTGRSIPDYFYQEASRRIASYPVDAGVTIYLQQMTTCFVAPNCPFSIEGVHSLIVAIQKNPYKKNVAHVAEAIRADFVWRAKQDLKQAGTIYKGILETDSSPRAAFIFNYLRILAEQGDDQVFYAELQTWKNHPSVQAKAWQNKIGDLAAHFSGKEK